MGLFFLHFSFHFNVPLQARWCFLVLSWPLNVFFLFLNVAKNLVFTGKIPLNWLFIWPFTTKMVWWGNSVVQLWCNYKPVAFFPEFKWVRTIKQWKRLLYWWWILLILSSNWHPGQVRPQTEAKGAQVLWHPTAAEGIQEDDFSGNLRSSSELYFSDISCWKIPTLILQSQVWTSSPASIFMIIELISGDRKFKPL